jgi:hypothetical protein
MRLGCTDTYQWTLPDFWGVRCSNLAPREMVNIRIEAVVHILTALAVAVSASPISTTSGYAVYERWSQPPPNSAKSSVLHPTAVFPVGFGLAQ